MSNETPLIVAAYALSALVGAFRLLRRRMIAETVITVGLVLSALALAVMPMFFTHFAGISAALDRLISSLLPASLITALGFRP